MIARTKDDLIGSRHVEMVIRIRKVLKEHRHDADEEQLKFLNDMLSRLNTFGSLTFMTVNQINKLTRIECDLEEARFNKYGKMD